MTVITPVSVGLPFEDTDFSMTPVSVGVIDVAIYAGVTAGAAMASTNGART